MRRILLPVAALALAGLAAVLARGWIEEQRQPVVAQAAPAAAVALKSVLVAADTLHPGSFVQPGALVWQDWPDVDVPDSYFVDGEREESDLLGAVVRHVIQPGEPITEGSIVMPGDRGFLAAVLDPDMRAVSVPVDEASSNAGLIFPGDRVDLILTQTLGEGGDLSTRRRVSETVLEDVRVIAMGRSLRGDGADAQADRQQARTATLEVTPRGAEKVALVTEIGKLSLSLRSLARSEPVDGGTVPAASRFTWDSDVSPVLRPENQPLSSITVMRGPSAEQISIRKGVAQ